MRSKLHCLLALSLSLLFSGIGCADTLGQAVQSTLNANPDVVGKKIHINAMHYAVQGAKGAFLPTVNLTASYGREQSLNSSTIWKNKTLWSKQAGIEARENLFNGFGDISELDRNKARLSSAEYKYLGVSEDTILNAVEAYLNVLHDQKIVYIAKQNYLMHATVNNMISDRAKTGITKQADLNQSMGRPALAQANLLSAESNLMGSKAAYERIIGSFPNTLSNPPIPPDKVLPKTLNEAINTALNNHPTLRSAMIDVDSTRAQNRAAYAANYPRIDAVVSGTRNRNINGVIGPDRDIFGGIQVSYNIFKGGSDYAKQKETAEYIGEAEEISKMTHRQVVETTRLSWDALKTTRSQIVFFQKYVANAKSTASSYREQFEIGKRSLLDVLNAEAEVFTASQSYENAKTSLTLAKFRLLNSEGRLLSFFGASV